MVGTSLKIVTLVLTFISGLGGVLLAQVCAETSWKRTLSCANCLAAGVLLAAGLVCMLPDASEGLPKGWGSIWAGAAVLALISVEEAAAALASKDNAPSDASAYLPLDADPAAKPNSKKAPEVSLPGPKIHSVLTPVSFWTTKTSKGQNGHAAAESTDTESRLAVDEWSCEAKMMVRGQSVSAVKAVCLFVALSFHSVMEGLGVGTSQKLSVLASISTAILAHKALAAFALGNALRQSGEISPRRLACMAVIFSSSTPCGIALGMYISHAFSGMIVAACTAIAAGTFCQVSMMEIIPLALQRIPGDGMVDRFLRLATLALGFIAMSKLVLLCG